MRTKRIVVLATFTLALVPCLYAQRTAPDYGTSNPTDYRMPAFEFTNATVAPTTWDPGSNNYVARSEAAVGPLFGLPHLPSGALLTSLTFDTCDTNPPVCPIGQCHMTLELVDCDRFGNCTPTPLATLSSAANATPCDTVAVDLTPLTYTVDNVGHELLLVASIVMQDGSNQFAGVGVGYKLQVSPPPAQATFNDVPTNHPFFQFIEALYASGITAGCGGGNYCPDNPVTRGQMAVFIAKALGL